MNRMRRRLVLAAALGIAPTARASDTAWQALAAGGCALLLRHAQTDPGVGDPPGFRLDVCSTQRNLSEAGREQARALGAALRTRGIAFDEVLSSQWCRCLDTARLVAPQPAVRPFAPLNSTFNDRVRAPDQRDAVRRYLQGLAAPRRALLVTHQVNVSALTGEAVAMGEGLVVRARGDTIDVLARLRT